MVDPSPFIVNSPDLGPAMPVTGAPIRDMIVVGAAALVLGLALLVLGTVLHTKEDANEPPPDAKLGTSAVSQDSDSDSVTESAEATVGDVIGQAPSN